MTLSKQWFNVHICLDCNFAKMALYNSFRLYPFTFGYILWLIFASLSILKSRIILWLLLWFYMASPAFAVSTSRPFVDISFSDFAGIIDKTFGHKVTLATVLTVLFTLTDNPDLIVAH